MNIDFTLLNARLSFASLSEPKAAKGDGKPRYCANFIIGANHPQRAAIDKIIADITKAEFPGRKIEGKDCALRDGSTMVNNDGETWNGYEGNLYISAARAVKRKAPRVVNRRKIDIEPIDPDYPESGDYVNAILSFYTVNGKTDKGGDPSYGKKICCEIGTVQLAKKGEPLGGGGGTGNLDDLPEMPDEEDDLV